MPDQGLSSPHQGLVLPYDTAWAAKAARHPKTGFVMFWGHRARKGQPARETCFSQWFPSPFRHQGQRYATAEHWMMAGKARLFYVDAAKVGFEPKVDVCAFAFQIKTALSRKPDPENRGQEVEHEPQENAEAANPVC